MLHRLEIENFQSIRDRQVIDLVAPGNAPDDPHRLAPLWEGSSEVGPKVIGIFGANASGKTTVLRALAFIAWFVRDSFSAVQPHAPLPLPLWRFHAGATVNRATRFVVHLSGIADVTKANTDHASECRYAYELVIGGPPEAHTVDSETLSYWPRGRRVKLFTRDASGKVTAGKDFQLDDLEGVLNRVLRPNASVISTLVQFKHPYSLLLWEAARRLFVVIERDGLTDADVTRYYHETPTALERLNREIQRADVGIREIKVQLSTNGPMLFFAHEGFDGLLPQVNESHGTRQFLKIFPSLIQALDTGGAAVIDEIDAALHPMLLSEILGWFHDPKRNELRAQLWATCQNPTLLDELSKDEILFCEKDRQGRTSVFSLRDVQGVRRDENHLRKYLGGIYGALPQIG